MRERGGVVHGGGGFGALGAGSGGFGAFGAGGGRFIADGGGLARGSRVREVEWSMTPWGGGFGAMVVDLVVVVVVVGDCLGPCLLELWEATVRERD